MISEAKVYKIICDHKKCKNNAVIFSYYFPSEGDLPEGWASFIENDTGNFFSPIKLHYCPKHKKLLILK